MWFCSLVVLLSFTDVRPCFKERSERSLSMSSLPFASRGQCFPPTAQDFVTHFSTVSRGRHVGAASFSLLQERGCWIALAAYHKRGAFCELGDILCGQVQKESVFLQCIKGTDFEQLSRSLPKKNKRLRSL